MDQSIKGQVIDLAKRDPFLTVDELAQKAGTTTRYVRTILSEADLSLNVMRRDYARRLERDFSAMDKASSIPVQRELKITRVAAEIAAPQIASWQGLELFQASALQTKGSLLGYAQLITPQELTVQADYDNLRDLLPKKGQQTLATGEQKASIVLASAELAELLRLSKFSQVLKLSSLLYQGPELLALETRWLGLEGLVLEWSQLEPELKVDYGS